MSNKDKILMVRMTAEQHTRLAEYAASKDVSMAKVLRDYIKRLPNLTNLEKTDQD